MTTWHTIRPASLRSFSRLVFPLLAVLAITVPRCEAQALYGSIVGTVQDSSGSVLANASIRISQTATGQSREVTTSDQGSYSVVDLLPGIYSVSISAPGFRTSQVTSVQVTNNTVSRVDAQLQLGTAAESITISADAVNLQSESADLHVALGTKEITHLPLSGYRNYQVLLNLVPGATPAAFQNSPSGSPGRSLATNINGTTTAGNNTRLDGASNMRATIPAQSLYVPPAESIENVNIATNSFDAEQGFAGGAAVNVITKSGTNQYHGAAFANHIDNALKAKNFFDLGTKTAKQILNTYGATFGGPIRKDKLFFFGSWEGMKERSNFTKIVTVATEAQRTGNFTGLSSIYDPVTGAADGTGRTVFPNNIIPANRQSAISHKMIALLPAANLPGNASNYFASSPVFFNRDFIDGKVNWTASEKTSVWGKYSNMNALVRGESSLGKAGGTGMLNGGGNGTGEVMIQVGAIGAVHTFTPNFLVDGVLAFSRDPLTSRGTDYGTNYGLEYLGIPGTNGATIRESGFPMFTIGGYETLGNPESYSGKRIRNSYFSYATNFGWTKGTHDLRFGVDIVRQRVSEWHPEIAGGPRGQFIFDGSVAALRGGASPSQFNNWAAFLLGLPQSVNKSIQTDDSTPRQWLEGYYIRDRWRATRNLTVIYGLRWEYYPIMSRAHTGIERYDVDDNRLYVGGVGSVTRNADITASKKLFAPRLGIAYKLGAKSVVRAGYGISINPYSLAATFLYNYPIASNQSFNGASTFIPWGPLENGIPPVLQPDTSSGSITPPLTAAVTTLPKGTFRRGYIQSFNFAVERELPAGFLGSVAYVGTRTIRQPVNVNINAASAGGGNPGRPLARAFGRTADTLLFSPLGAGRYEAVQARLDRRLNGGVVVKVAYTFSKSINFADGDAGTLLFNDTESIGRNRALAGYDRPHNLRTAVIADLPFGAGKHWLNEPGVARAILSGWQANGIFSAYSGTPFSVLASGSSLNAPGQTQTADQQKSEVVKLGGVGTASPFYDPAAFATVTQVRFGNTGRNVLRGPGLVNLDASLFRNFKFNDRWQLQFRAEGLNVTNTPHFGNPNNNVSNSGFLTITTALNTSNNVEGGERQFRFGLKLTF